MEQHHSLQHYLDFLEVFNDVQRFKTSKDVATFLGVTAEAVRSKAKRYRSLRRSNPELGLPPIVDRRNVEEDGTYPLLDESLGVVRDSCIDYRKIRGNKKYVITSAQYGAKVNALFLRSLKLYCKENNAELIVLPIKYGSMFEPMGTELDGLVCYKSLRLNNSIGFNVTHLRPTLMNPLSGMEKFGYDLGQVFASPKVAFKMVATSSPDRHKPIMTTGSVTYPYYQLSKTGSVAERDHKFGAVVVDIKDDKRYHFRHLISPDGNSFSDAATMREYTPTGAYAIEGVSAVVPGDWHTGQTCPKVKEATFTREDSIVKETNPEYLVMHDFFDGYSISHHTAKNATVRARMAERGLDVLGSELALNADEVRDLLNHMPDRAKMFMVASNHNDHLDRYLAETRYTDEPRNTALGAKLHAASISSGLPAFRYFIQNVLTNEQNSRILWGGRNQEFTIEGIECSMHGDVGANGGRGNPKMYDKFCHGSVVGHSHSPSIEGNNYTAGTSTKLILPYTKGLSSWLNTHAVIFPTGQVQLINIIDGEWK